MVLGCEEIEVEREQNAAIMVARDFVGTFMQGRYFMSVVASLSS
jgi:hypothetical protein